MPVEHDPSKCPLCGDLLVTPVTNYSTGWLLNPIELHLIAKVQELEARLQHLEWQNTPLGPRQEESNVPDPRVVETLKRLELKEPECQACFDEEGSYSCIRYAHQKRS